MRLFQIDTHDDFCAGFLATDDGLAYHSAPKISAMVMNRGIDKITRHCRSMGWAITELTCQGQLDQPSN